MDAVWERIRGNRYDLRAWRQVLQHASQQAIQEARPLYEEVLRAFPTAWWVWRLYAEAELAHARADSSTVEAIFSRCLLRCRFVSLWRVYIRYVFNAFAEGSSSGVRARLEALEFALNHVGLDPSSGELWLQYVSLLRRVDPSFLPDSTDPSGAESARMVKVRRAFHQALSIPQSHIDFLWHEYERFEHSISAKLAKPMLEELRPKMQAARSVLEERQRLFDRLPDAALAGPPSEMRNSEEVSKAWRNYLTLERRNTQRVGEEALVKRVCLAYDQCLCCLTMYPEMWLEYITWLEERARPLDACNVCERAAEALPECLSLRLLHADLLEATGEHERAKESLESLLGELEQQALIASDEDDELLGQRNERADNATAGNHDSSEGAQAVEENDEEREKYNHIALAYIHYMRLLRRTEGRESARKLFAVARKERHCRWEVYAAAAELEYRTESDTRISKNIFELGLKRFGHRAEYALHYADFLTRVNDLGNARALFERALELVDHGRVKDIWDRYARFEHENGDMESITRVESRRRNALGDQSETPAENAGILLSRYMFGDLKPCSESQRKHFAQLGGLASTLAQGYSVALGSQLSAAHMQRSPSSSDSQQHLQQQVQASEQAQAGDGSGTAFAPPAHCADKSSGAAGDSQPKALGVDTDGSSSFTIEGFLQQLPSASSAHQPLMAPEEILRAVMSADLSEDAEQATDAALKAIRGGGKRKRREDGAKAQASRKQENQEEFSSKRQSSGHHRRVRPRQRALAAMSVTMATASASGNGAGSSPPFAQPHVGGAQPHGACASAGTKSQLAWLLANMRPV